MRFFLYIYIFQAKCPYLVITNILLPFFWYFVGCFVEDRLRKEVSKTDNLIIKHLIDFRCGKSYLILPLPDWDCHFISSLSFYFTFSHSFRYFCGKLSCRCWVGIALLSNGQKNSLKLWTIDVLYFSFFKFSSFLISLMFSSLNQF